jgi:hypothetical protein
VSRVRELNARAIHPPEGVTPSRLKQPRAERPSTVAPNWERHECWSPIRKQIEPVTLGKILRPACDHSTCRAWRRPCSYFTSAALNQDSHDEFSAEVDTWVTIHTNGWGSDEPDPNGTDTAPKYPKVTVKLVGKDANAFGILGKVATAMDEAGVP